MINNRDRAGPPIWQAWIGRTWALTLALLAGCNVSSLAPTTARFDLTSDELFDVPFPNDLRRRADGTLELKRIASGHGALLQHYIDLIASGRFGFSGSGAIYVRFNGAIEPRSLPSTPRASLAGSASLRLVDIEPRSPTYGESVPLRWRYYEEASGAFIPSHTLAALPVYGFPLGPGRRYALIVTDGVLDHQGRPVSADPTLRRLLEDQPPARDAEAHAIYQPLRDYLRGQGITGVISATVLTAGEHTSVLGKVRQVISARPAPEASRLRVVAEAPTYWEVQGTYSAPAFQQGTPPFSVPADGGAISFDSEGQPEVARHETLRFALTVPKGEMPDGGWPLAIYAHGTGGDYRSGIRAGVAARLARVTDERTGVEIARLATLSSDQTLHGPRAPEGTLPELTFLNLQNPEASIYNLVQGAADGFSLLRMIEQLRFSRLTREGGTPPAPRRRFETEARLGELPRRDPARPTPASTDFGGEVRFDVSRVSLFGHSQGALTGALLAAIEPKIRATVLSGGGGVGVLTMLQRKRPVDFSQIIALLLREQVDPFHPVVTMIQQILDPADPINYAPLLLLGSPTANNKDSPRHLLITEGLIDQETPPDTTEALATAAGCPLVGPALRPVASLGLRQLAAGPLPTSGNIVASGHAVTAGLLQYKAALPASSTPCDDDSDCASRQYCDNEQRSCRRDGHFVAFDREDARRQWSIFLGSFARDGLPLLVEP